MVYRISPSGPILSHAQPNSIHKANADNDNIELERLIRFRKRFDREALKGAPAGDSRPVPADPERAGIKHPAVFP